MTDRPLPPRPGPGRGEGAGDAEAPAPSEAEAPAPSAKPTKAARLEARAARLREAEERRAQQRQAAAAADGEGNRAGSRAQLVSTVLLGVLSAGLIAVLVIGFFSWQHQRDIDKAHAGALKAAKAFALDFGAYDYRTLDADFTKVTKGMTASFAKDYSAASTKLKPTLVQYKTHVTASIQGAGVTVGGTAKATVVVFLDQLVSTSQSTVPRLDRNRLQMQLVRHDGKWLVANLLAK
jgi:Mce-associated membrane protein